MAKKITKTISPEARKAYEKLVHSLNLEVLSNFGFPYTSLNGHMYSLLSKSNRVGLRLPKGEREAFLEKYQTSLYQPEPGPLLKEYVTVPEALLHDVESLKPYLRQSLEYVQSLKPKPPKKKK